MSESTTVTAVTDDTFASEVLESSTPVLVDFWATWCAPCRQMAPIIEELAAEMEGKVRFAKIDTDANPQTAMQYGIVSIPTFNLYSGGELVTSIVGGRPKNALREELENALG